MRELPLDQANHMFGVFLNDREEILRAFTHTRDKVVFTTEKLICLDVQGLTGKKQEYRFFPYSRITSFSVETPGTFDGDSDFKIWISGAGMFQIKFGRSINIKQIAVFLSRTIT